MNEKTSALTKAKTLFISIYLLFLLMRFLPASWFPKGHITSVFFYIVLAAVGIYALRKDFADWFRWVRKHIGKSVLYLILCYVVFMAGDFCASLASEGLFRLFHLNSSSLINDINIQSTLSVLPAPVILLVLGILGPMVEELIFRKCLFCWLQKHVPAGIAILLSAVCFAAVHMNAISAIECLNVLPHFVSGLVLGYFYYKTDNLMFPIAVHAFNNASTLALALL